MLLSERWHGYGLRNWSRGRCFLVGGVSRVFGLVVVVVGMPVLLPAGASTEGMWQTASDWSLCRRIRSVAGIRGARVRCSLLLILCVLVCTAIPAAASADRIAFTKYPATLETTGIWTADAATGENQVQIKGTAGAGWPALSPSGIRIAYLANEGSELYVINTDGTGKRKLTTSNGGQIGWSPDGKDVVFTRGLPERRVYVVNVSNGEERSLGGTPGYYENYPCWSRDGRYIAFQANVANGTEPAKSGLYYMNADGSGEMKTIVAGEEEGAGGYRYDSWCSFGAGDIIAYVTKSSYKETNQIFTVHLNGTGKSQLTSGERAHETPKWNKQGTKIAYNYSTEPGPCGVIATMGPTGGEQKPFLEGTYPTCYWEPSLEEPYLFGVPEPEPEELLGLENPGEPQYGRACAGKPVNCATGNEVVSQTDLAVGGRGVGLNLARTYNAQAAVSSSAPEPFGRGWRSSFSDHLVFNSTEGWVKVVQANGSTVKFKGTPGVVGEFTAPEWAQATLSLNSEHIYVYTLPDQQVFKFSEEGRLLSETDRDGNTTSLAYNEAGHLETVSDPAGRKLTFAYNSEGLVESVKDPMGHTVKYGYEGGNLTSVTEPGEASARWQFKYDSSHRLTTMTDGRGGTTTNEYDGSNRVISQTDPLEHTLTFEYGTSETKITNHATGAVTKELFTKGQELESITHGYGTASATSEAFTYDEAGEVMTAKDGNDHTTEYGYDSAGNRTKMVDPNEHETKWAYDSTHDVISTTTPKGETTTIKRDSHGNPEVIERPAPAGKTQITKDKFNSLGELESVTDPLERTTKYEYDTQGDRTVEIDPEGDKRTWGYNEDSQETSTVSPRGNVTGGEPAKYTTTIERDAQGRALKVTDPLGHTTKYAYDANGNLETQTDANSHTTTYTYDADNERTKVKEPNGAVTETGYDGAGQVTSQTDGNKHETKYVRNVLEQVTEVVDPLGRKTTKEYDGVGNLKALTDPAKRTTTYTYDAANRLKEVGYSDGKTHALKYEYDADGDRTSMTDGTGTTSYTYDQLDRLTESKDGHGDVAKYEYDLANELTKITYPNGKAVTRAYDKAGRLEKVTDWLEHTTKFAYDPNSNLTTSTFPSGTSNVDKYAYNETDQMSEDKMTKGAEALASLTYTRDNNSQIKTTTSKGLPGAESTEYTYDTNSRLTKAGTTGYEYDPADNPTKIASSTYTYDKASELETGTGFKYTYDEMGERTKTAPTSGAATTYGYDQAGNLISIERPKEGKTAGLTDAFTYDGNNLRVSQTISGTKTYLTWQMTEAVPLILNDGTNSYIYGPGGLPVEQISSGGTVTYLHHDQQGSTRLLTGSTGTVTGKCSYSPYGTPTCEGTITTPLGFDGQYISSDTGLIYLRARVYDPATAQFLTVDPEVGTTRAPYNYAGDNPVNWGDASGRSSWNPFSESFWTEGNFISESPLNPIPYYEAEIESYENGCGYLASVAHGLEGVVVGALDASGLGEEGLAAEEGSTAIEDALAGLKAGNSPGVYTVDSPEELQQIYDELSSGGKPTGSSYSGQEVELSNGTRVGIRETSKSGGPTIDINQGGTQYKIHVAQ